MSRLPDRLGQGVVAKMASMRWWAKFRRLLSRILVPVLRRLPPPVALRTAGGLGHFAYRVLPPTRQRFIRAVEQWKEYFQSDWNGAEVARALAANELRWQLRDVLLDHLSAEQIESVFQIEGRAHLDAARARGRGVVLLGNHFGAHLQAAHWLLRHEFPLRIYMERPRRISSFLTRHFELDGPLGQQKLFISRASEATESASSILRATRILKAGMILLMASDVRWTGAHTVTESFLGRRFEFSSTWALLAGMTGAPVVPVFCRILPEGCYRVEFLEPWILPREVARGERIAEYVRRSLALIETRVQSDPANCNEYARWLEIEDGVKVDRARNAA